MAWNARVMSFLLASSLGCGLLPTAPAHAEFTQMGSVEVRVAQHSLKPKRIRYSAPEYPSKALDAGLSGFVAIEFVVNSKGEPTELRVVDAMPAEIFDRAVLKAARRWRYQRPALDSASMRAIVHFEVAGQH